LIRKKEEKALPLFSKNKKATKAKAGFRASGS
jgi:hypothetical protein